MSKNEVRSWTYLGMAAVAELVAAFTGRHDMATNGLILVAISTIYGTRSDS